MGKQQDRPLQWQETIWLLIAFLTPLWVNLWVEQQFEASKIWLLRTLVFLLGAIWLGATVGRKPDNPLPRNVMLLCLTLACIITLSTLLSDNRYIATFGSLERAGGAVTQLVYLLLFLIMSMQLSREMRMRLLRVIVWTGVPIGLFGLAQLAGWQPLSVLTDARTGIATTIGRSNFTAAYLAMLVPLTLAEIVRENHEEERRNGLAQLGWAGLVVVEVAVIVGTRARAGLIALAVGLAIFAWLKTTLPSHSTLSKARGSALRLWIGLGLGFLTLLGTLGVVMRGIASGGSIAARWTIWRASLGLLWRSPWLGYGGDTLELIFPAVYPPELVYYQGRGLIVDRAHNWLLDWSLSYGVVATGLLIALVGTILWQQRKTQNRTLQACIASICAQLAGNLFLFEVAATATLFWLLMAVLLSALIDANLAPREHQGESERWRYWGVGLGVLVVFGLGWQVSGKPLLADAASWRGTRLVGQGDWHGAAVQYATATSWQPQRAAYWVALGVTEMQLGEYISAENHLLHAQSLRPSDPQILHQLGTLYATWAFNNDPAKISAAYAAYAQAIELAPTIGLTYQRYADVALRAGAFPLAIEQAEHAFDLDATDGVAFGILGWARLQMGDATGAEAAFLEAVRWTASADNYLGLATAYFQQNNLAAARVAVRQSLTVDPNYEPALILQLQLEND